MRKKKDSEFAPSRDDEEPTQSNTQGQQRRETLEEETGEILEEIDEVLEDNAQNFIRSFTQYGGQ